MEDFEELKIVSVFSYFHMVGNIPADIFFFSVIFFIGLSVFAFSAFFFVLLFAVAWFFGLSVLFKYDPQALTILKKTIKQKPVVFVNTEVPNKRFIINN
jgi:hypothetical protein